MVPQTALHGKEDPGDPERETSGAEMLLATTKISPLGPFSIGSYRSAISDRKVRARELERFLDEVRKLDGAFLKFSKEAWLGLCDRITLMEKGKAAVRFRSGVEIEVEY